MVSALDLVTSSVQVEGFNPHCGQKVESEKSECNNSGYKLTGLTLVAMTDWGGANSRFLGLVSVGAARSFDQTALKLFRSN